MKRRIMLIGSLAALLIMLLIVAGCGGKDDSASQAESAAPAETKAEHPTEHPAAQAAETATETAAVHDCAGGCGMTAVPESEMTEIDGKWYCAGCAKKIQEEKEHAGHDHG